MITDSRHLLILAKILNCQPNEVFFVQNQLNIEQKVLFEEQKKLLSQGYPLDYLLGQIDFLGFKFFVDENVLIPRSETEFWLKKLQADLLESEQKNELLIDVGCGSGVIGLSLSNLFKKVILTDIFMAALEVAKQNASLNNIEHVEFVQTNLLENLEQKVDKQNWILVANLPYLPQEDLTFAKENKVEFEPKIALYSGQSGLDLFNNLLQQLELNFSHNFPQKVYFELDPRNILTARDLLIKLDFEVEIWQDENDLNRVLVGKKKRK